MKGREETLKIKMMASSFFNVVTSGIELLSALGIFFKHETAGRVKGEELDHLHMMLVTRMAEVIDNLQRMEIDALNVTSETIRKPYRQV
jgi:hypothetical protein